MTSPKRYQIVALVVSEYDLNEPSGIESVQTALESIDTELDLRELLISEVTRTNGWSRR